MMCTRWLSGKFILTGVMLGLLLGIGKSSAQLNFYEDFERPREQWPWDNWEVRPMQPRPDAHTWGVEDSSLFYPANPGSFRSLWCSGFPDDLQPGADNYIISPDEPSWIRYGPFDLSDAVAAQGSCMLWAEMESNENGDGMISMSWWDQGENPGDNMPTWGHGTTSFNSAVLPYVNRTGRQSPGTFLKRLTMKVRL